MTSQTTRLAAAFPPGMQSEVESVAWRLELRVRPATDADVGPIEVSGSVVRIPQRIYPLVPSEALALFTTPRQGLILNCLLSRHHNGFVREAALRQIVGAAEPWVVPFVVQLAGEYVVELLQIIERDVHEGLSAPYGEFLRTNPAFAALTRQRILSYWNCYHRISQPDFSEYVGARILSRFDSWARAAAQKEAA